MLVSHTIGNAPAPHSAPASQPEVGLFAEAGSSLLGADNPLIAHILEGVQTLFDPTAPHAGPAALAPHEAFQIDELMGVLDEPSAHAQELGDAEVADVYSQAKDQDAGAAAAAAIAQGLAAHDDSWKEASLRLEKARAKARLAVVVAEQQCLADERRNLEATLGTSREVPQTSTQENPNRIPQHERHFVPDDMMAQKAEFEAAWMKANPEVFRDRVSLMPAPDGYLYGGSSSRMANKPQRGQQFYLYGADYQPSLGIPSLVGFVRELRERPTIREPTEADASADEIGCAAGSQNLNAVIRGGTILPVQGETMRIRPSFMAHTAFGEVEITTPECMLPNETFVVARPPSEEVDLMIEMLPHEYRAVVETGVSVMWPDEATATAFSDAKNRAHLIELAGYTGEIPALNRSHPGRPLVPFCCLERVIDDPHDPQRWPAWMNWLEARYGALHGQARLVLGPLSRFCQDRPTPASRA